MPIYDENRTAIKERAAKNDRVELVSWAPSEWIDDNETVPPGTRGTVDWVDDAGTVFVRWDNGSRLGVAIGDELKVVRRAKR